MSRPTPQQLSAIDGHGNLLVVAGAGTGKTRTLVSRCLRLLIREHASLDDMLMVTFTEAAAAEMRARIRAALRELQSAHPEDEHLAEQLASLDSARICTLHSFCLQLTREHFHELGLDPQFSVLDERQTRPLVRATLDELLERYYDGDDAEARSVQALIRVTGRGTDIRIRKLVLKLHAYAQSLPDPARWLNEQQRRFAQAEPVEWRQWFVQAVTSWRDEWSESVSALAGVAPALQRCSNVLKGLPANPSPAEAAGALRAVLDADGSPNHWPSGTKGRGRDPLEGFFTDAEFLGALSPGGPGPEPLAQDWEWARGHMSALIALTSAFTLAFSIAKRELGGLDFADLEQCALRLLRNPATARAWRARLGHVFVDEYQDINEAQDTILASLSREGGAANRFLVGDVKQSIYRFRLANPRIFSAYSARWSDPGAEGRRIPLAENFRSREALLNFINPLFASLMRKAVGGVDYEPLQFGAPDRRAALAQKPEEPPRVELHLIARAGEEAVAEESEEDSGRTESKPDLLAIEREARLLALRFREMKEDRHAIWDETDNKFRPVRWSDMAVLLRSPAGRAEAFAKEFSAAGVPLTAARDGFFGSLEISDLVSLLKLLDNPIQDLPLLAVLRSQLAGLTLDELAEVRAQNPAKQFWTTLAVFHRDGKAAGQLGVGRGAAASSAWVKTDLFLRQFARWREGTRHASLLQSLDRILAETHFEAMLMAGPRGTERVANVRRFLDLAQQFDPYRRQGLYRFLRFIQSQEDEALDLQPASAASEDAVRLLSVHKSKGLEFPVVALACMGTKFNEQDLNQPVLLNEVYGLCPKITPPGAEQSYPGLPHWLARRAERRELRGEELRLLYVALTRARDTLILVGTTGRKAGDLRPEAGKMGEISTAEVVGARSQLDWLMAWLSRTTTQEEWFHECAGANKLLRWDIRDPNDPLFAEREELLDLSTACGAAGGPGDAGSIEKVKAVLAWKYPFLAATVEPAKTSVSGLRVRISAEMEDEAKPLFRQGAPRIRDENRLSAAQIGSAHHLVLQSAALDKMGSAADLKNEADRLSREGLLTPEEAAVLDFDALAAFWQSDMGKKILAQPQFIHREIPFTARFSPADFAEIGLKVDVASDEFVVVQGVVDLAVIRPGEIWIVDFKTDEIKGGGLAEKIKAYEPQLKLYARALARIYGRSVTESCLYFLSANRTVPVSL